jgi:AcrR family transcriptional regulator
MAKINNVPLDQSTEEKIKQSAEKVFMEKGFFGARTRDIADEAGINLALLNYYFRSKENLFKIIMEEKLKQFFGFVIDVLRDPNIPLQNKVKVLVNKYTDMLIKLPELPIFVLGELKRNPNFFVENLKVKERFQEGVADFLKTYNVSSKEELAQIMLSLLGMTIFPFLGKDIILSLLDFSNEEYHNIIDKRRELIPIWMEEIIKIQLK